VRCFARSLRAFGSVSDYKPARDFVKSIPIDPKTFTDEIVMQGRSDQDYARFSATPHIWRMALSAP
jgi:hypothetical protein